MAGENKDTETKHSLSQVWQEVHRHGVAIGELQTGVRSIEASVNQLVNAMNRPKPPVNWIAIGSLAVAILIAGGTYAKSVLAPVEQNVTRLDANQTEYLKTLPEHYLTLGRSLQQVEQNTKAITELHQTVDALLQTGARLDERTITN